MFCVECGVEGQELIGSICPEGYSKKHVWAKIPDHVDLVLCTHCSSMEVGEDWKDIGSVGEGIETVLRSSLELPDGAKLVDLKVRLEERDPRNMLASVDVRLTTHGLEFDRSLNTIVRMKRGSCKECSKMMGSYYEAMLPVRTTGREREGESEGEIESFVRARTAAL